MKRAVPIAFVSVLIAALSVPAFAAGNDPCKVLTAEKFSQIMGYTATIDKTGSNQTSCFYKGRQNPADSL